MTNTEIRFDDGAAYEQMMGIWSRHVGDVFIDWLRPGLGLRWADIGCGNGAFSDLLAHRLAPAYLCGVDPSEAQLAYARDRLSGHSAEFIPGDATALPLEDRTFDAAVMALVIFFVPEPDKGVAEMARITRPGGSVSAYAWDILGGGLPVESIVSELPSIGMSAPLPPNPGAADTAALVDLWKSAGLIDIETRAIVVKRSFSSFDEFWKLSWMGPMARLFASLTGDQARDLKSRVQRRFQPDADGGIVCEARANAVKGIVPV